MLRAVATAARSPLLARSLSSRLATRSLCSSAAKGGYKGTGKLYSEVQAKTGRPISPHLDVYVLAGTLPAIAWSSIMVRITGVAASAGFFVLGGATVLGGGEWAVDMAQRISEAVSPTATKFTVAFVLS